MIIKNNKIKFIQIFLFTIIFIGKQCYTFEKSLFDSFIAQNNDKNCSFYNQTNCHFCGPGKYYNSSIEQCSCCILNKACDECPECPEGYFNRISNATQCLPCEKGFFNK